MRRVVAFAVSFAALLAAAVTVAQPSPAWWGVLPDGVSPPGVPAGNLLSDAKIALGRRLFYDADLSIDGTVSCATCHEQHRAFTEGNRTHAGVGGVPGRRNVMPLANVAYFSPLTWADPRQRDLESQALVPLMGTQPVEMGMAGKDGELARRLSSDDCYRQMFAAAFPENKGRIDTYAVTKALAAFERTLVSFDSPYDRFRRGDERALSEAAKRGAVLFQSQGCAKCHAGPNFTDGAFHNIGGSNAGALDDGRDHGLREITGKASDESAFRTPTLRNAALTGPYMHDGSAADLGAAIRAHFAGTNPLRDESLAGRTVDERQLADILAFLESLSDRSFITNPSLALPKTACGKPNY